MGAAAAAIVPGPSPATPVPRNLGVVFTGPLGEVFAAFHAGKDYHAPYRKYLAMQKLMADLHAGIDDYRPMKYALGLQMGGPQTYARLPGVEVTEAQKAAIKEGLARMKQVA